MTDPIDKYTKHRAAALAKVERRIEREIAAIEAAGLDPVLATIAEIIAAGVELDNDLDGIYSPRKHTNYF
jgi:hypothetical protein